MCGYKGNIFVYARNMMKSGFIISKNGRGTVSSTMQQRTIIVHRKGVQTP